MTRSKLLGAVLALPLMIAGASSAQANVISLNLDGSGSISSSDFTLQKNGYISALTALLQPDGLNSIAVYQFSNTVQQVFALTTISTAAQKTALLTAIGAMSQIGSTTAIGDSITTAKNAINTFTGNTCTTTSTCLIDVSTDGVNNTGLDPNTATTTANASGIKVNCLGVGGSANCGWNNAGLDFTASSFSAFTAAITSKLSVELTKAPEPITITVFGAGLAGAASLRRRKKKAA
jgi:hypothetical protein